MKKRKRLKMVYYMPKIPKGKKGVFIYIDENLWKEFVALIKVKYSNTDRVRGLLSWEIEQALRNWVSLHNNKHTQIHTKVNPSPVAFRVHQQIKEYLEGKYGIDFSQVQQIHRKFLIEAIEATRGSDKRTIKKWINELLKYKLIKFITPQIVEIV